MSEQTRLALLEELEQWLFVENQKIQENIRKFENQEKNAKEVLNNEQ